MNRGLVALRRLGAPICCACDDVLDYDPASIPVSSVEDFEKQFGRRPKVVAGSVGSAVLCDGCRQSYLRALNERQAREMMAKAEAGVQLARDRVQTQRDLHRSMTANSREYVAEVRRHRKEIKHAMRSWKIGGIFGGGGD